jgi:phage gp36-like protein
MAAYCSQTELSQWGVSSGALTGITPDELNAAIAGASDLIDSYLRGKFTLPLTAWGDDISRACAILACYDGLSVRGYNPGDPGDDQLQKRYDQVIAWLKGISSGTITPNATGSASGDTAGVPSSRAKVTSNSLRGWYESAGGSGGAFTGRR